MLRKLGLILFICLSLMFTIEAQTNEDIKKKSDENRSNKSNNANSYSYSDSDEDDFSADMFADGCVGCLIGVGLIGEIFNAMALTNDSIALCEPVNPRIFSTDLFAGIGFIPNKYTVLLPRMRINGALISTDFRVYSNTENRLEGTDSYSTLDWQILQFNVVNTKEFNFRIGSGVMLETYSSLIFNEHTIALDFYPHKALKFGAELRATMDYKTSTMVRSEIDLSAYIRLKKIKNTTIYGFANYLGADYYQSVKLWTLSFGLAFNFDYKKGSL